LSLHLAIFQADRFRLFFEEVSEVSFNQNCGRVEEVFSRNGFEYEEVVSVNNLFSSRSFLGDSLK
jgi:hypothetical protein